MAGFVGLNECAEFDTTGSGGYVAFDKVDGGSFEYEEGDLKEDIGIGGSVVEYRDMIVPVGKAITTLQTTTLLALCNVATIGVLPTVIEKIHGGPKNDASARLQTDCYLGGVKLSQSKGGVIKAEYRWKALAETTDTITTAATISANKPLVQHACSVKVGGNGYKSQTWELELSNDPIPRNSGDLKTAATQRLPEWFDPGEWRVNLTAAFRMPVGINLLADIPATIAFTVAGTTADGTPRALAINTGGGNGLFPVPGGVTPLAKGTDEVLYEIKARSLAYDFAVWCVTLA